MARAGKQKTIGFFLAFPSALKLNGRLFIFTARHLSCYGAPVFHNLLPKLGTGYSQGDLEENKSIDDEVGKRPWNIMGLENSQRWGSSNKNPGYKNASFHVHE